MGSNEAGNEPQPGQGAVRPDGMVDEAKPAGMVDEGQSADGWRGPAGRDG